MGSPPSEPITLAVIGCGQRGTNYAAYALDNPKICKVVTIADPLPKTRDIFTRNHKLDRTLVFNTWQELLKASAETIQTIGKRLADAVIVAVQDHMHYDVVLAFAAQGYHILCEKPMATSPRDCLGMEKAVKSAGIIFGMGHVLRYSPYSKALTEVVRSGQLGDLINAVHIEPVGYFHFSHSFVRGSWKKESESSFSLMTKSCHDIDILCHWLSPATPTRVSSFGSLQHFRKEKKPIAAGTATRCLECPMEQDCAYSAKKIYLEPVSRGNTHWPADTIVDGIPDIENITEALCNGPYGQCVYESDNDVCDHQVVNIEYSSGATASFTMVAYTSLICERQTRLHFSHGEIIGDMNDFTVTDFRTGRKTTHHPKNEGGGFGGGDLGLIRAFVEAVRTGNQDLLGTNVSEVLKSYLTIFAAETSRREGRIVNCAEFEKAIRAELEV
ncbi:NAD(P)-binding protein [Rhizopogon vinicolor AM-OR11-026]|uniref:NAD(P)-binding protein n=1 Tax=Rhizopogon vinicolor AM-OR11-026 TaxID=1314800 RepID=A0A1B7NGE0_9AGAM|nr:NAD(P)-binding protein [Rhizopogon vinicolor AM-OR11-026]